MMDFGAKYISEDRTKLYEIMSREHGFGNFFVFSK